MAIEESLDNLLKDELNEMTTNTLEVIDHNLAFVIEELDEMVAKAVREFPNGKLRDGTLDELCRILPELRSGRRRMAFLNTLLKSAIKQLEREAQHD